MHLAREINDQEIEADPICGVLYMRALAVSRLTQNFDLERTY